MSGPVVSVAAFVGALVAQVAVSPEDAYKRFFDAAGNIIVLPGAISVLALVSHTLPGAYNTGDTGSSFCRSWCSALVPAALYRVGTRVRQDESAGLPGRPLLRDA